MLRQMIRRWLTEDDNRPQIQVAEQPYSTYGARAAITGITNGYLVSVGDSTTYIATLDDINEVLPGLIARERMQRNGKTERY
jgi:hypothetical protein